MMKMMLGGRGSAEVVAARLAVANPTPATATAQKAVWRWFRQIKTRADMPCFYHPSGGPPTIKRQGEGEAPAEPGRAGFRGRVSEGGFQRAGFRIRVPCFVIRVW